VSPSQQGLFDLHKQACEAVVSPSQQELYDRTSKRARQWWVSVILGLMICRCKMPEDLKKQAKGKCMASSPIAKLKSYMALLFA